MNVIKPLVLSKVVENDLCIGCGVCVQACPSKALNVDWNNYGFLVATVNDNSCDSCGCCVEVCPFNPEPNSDDKNEDDLAKVFLSDASKNHLKIGCYHSIHVGYSKKHRQTSSSGGVATFIYEKLFEKGLINHVVTVGESASRDAHYQYIIISNKDELINISKTRYHPVTLASVLEKIKQLEGRVAISGVGCFIKAIRLTQQKDVLLKEKIAFLVGIICGGVKSKFFTDYLAGRAGALIADYSAPEYRLKDPTSTASDYSFSCIDNPTSTIKMIKMREVGDMWGTGLFKANACDFCDDVTTELADISLGDAWLKPYNEDGNGHNVIVSRSVIAEQILLEGAESGELILENLPLDVFLSSQRGSFNHRHDGMGTRMDIAENAGKIVPPKRVPKVRQPIYLRLVQQIRRKTRLKSLKFWRECKDAVDFDKRMKRTLLQLKFATRLSSIMRKIKI